MKKIVTLLMFLSALLFAQPTIDGTITDATYTTVASFTSGRDGFGAGNLLKDLKYYQDGTNLYIGLSCDLSSNDNVIIFFNFSGYGGRSTNTLAGTSTSSVGAFTTTSGGLDQAKMDFDVDFAFAFNEGNNTTNLYMDAARFGSGAAGYLATAFVGQTTNQTGTSASLDPTAVTGGTGNITLAYDNSGSLSDKGVEFKIPIASFSGITNVQTVAFFVLITSGAGFISNECIPGDLGATNPGNDADLSAISGQTLFTSPDSPLPVELTSFSASVKNKSVNLVWHTATEVNNYGFEIEKRQSSIANSQWSKVGFVNGNGNSNSANEYSYTDKTVTSGKYTYRLKQIDNDGKYEYSKEVEVDLGKPTSFALNQNYPNPFNPSTSIQYSVVGSQYVSLKVFNVLGKEVAVLVNEKQEPGTYTVDFTSANLSGGAYFYRLQAGEFMQTKKMILLK